jgi:RND family efflux transporter MFP subunit
MARCCLVSLVVLAWIGCRREADVKPRRAPDTSAPRSVQVATVYETALERSVTVIGSLLAQDQATLSAKVAGRLHAIAVDLGSPVREGQLLAEIEPVDYELQLKQARALLAQARARLGLPLDGDSDQIEPEKTSTVRQTKALLEESRKNRERVLRLSAQGIISQSELETADAAYEVALNHYQDALLEVWQRQGALAQRRAEFEIARQQLADARIQAPFDGVVQERKASKGEYLVVGGPVLTVVRVNPLRLRLEVPERIAPAVRAGQSVRLAVEGDTNQYTGQIARLRPAINEQDRMLIVEADVQNNGQLRPGSFARADIIIEEKGLALTVPPQALLIFAGVEKAFVCENGKAVERIVETGRRAPQMVEVLSGLRKGESVVLQPGGLQTGQSIAAERTTTRTADPEKPRSL